ncbi:hypothetical protein B0A58_10275 [Flavobacterium branchiophilum NBRC 15030 = ATCC 35035]|uniref:Uncharacterized protein n=1 Tax=Flavobacterium branchiophilum TaxID=55197 RepID=A0A543G753_9FLAO|nr:hypothetical protein [Flavobacterium branchiophilum]OXA74694.1 hypothetical protein B0A58_10275 [Flavobacterium branchiophilum NBRC 15030 = ATCC 35035]TQM41918.1 hypothetical protein BC670_2933 [Flavobacterium branchiophilum]GEM55388.1 hypothetical protein FB1_16090 [Flavobacterium branchiophilum NBRC 15030 = ATCC 35035]
MSISISTFKQSIANLLDKKKDENEDSIESLRSSDEMFYSWVLCDGAGGVGVFCKEWAQFLCKSIPNNPAEFGLDIRNWFENTSIKFHEEIILKADLTDLILNRKVYQDGSYSTLTACWLDKMANEFYYTSIGDSCFFFFEETKNGIILKQLSSINEQDEIESYPNLLNWNDDLLNELPFNSFEIINNFICVMASDSLAKWILLNIALIDFSLLVDLGINQSFLKSLNNQNLEFKKSQINMNHDFKKIKMLLNYLKSISRNEEEFINNMKLLHTNNEIEIDDYSLIYIEGNVSI